MNILVTGANGFVGSALIERLINDGHHVTALVRSKVKVKHRDGVKWLKGDLLAPEDLPPLDGIEKAFYLVHGLKSSEKDFEYEESCAAVNFINWIRPTGSGIIYLGGLGPKNEKLSPHLRSRHLTGAILGASGFSTIEFRASIILGAGSLSFEMIKAMAERFPIRPDMPLLRQLCQPLALSDLLDYLSSALSLNSIGHSIIEIGGPEALTYGELLDQYARVAKLVRLKIKLPEVEPKILMRALDYAIPEFAQIGKKLTESLEHPTVVSSELAKTTYPEINPMGLQEALSLAHSASKTNYAPIWEKDFLKGLISDKILLEARPAGLRHLEKFAKVKKMISRK
jgi:uncharacterized protein YbjT (DUF2867 family)